MKTKLATAKKFVLDRQTKILVTTVVVTTTAAVLMKTGLTQHDNFLKENGLYDAFYALTD